MKLKHNVAEKRGGEYMRDKCQFILVVFAVIMLWFSFCCVSDISAAEEEMSSAIPEGKKSESEEKTVEKSPPAAASRVPGKLRDVDPPEWFNARRSPEGTGYQDVKAEITGPSVIKDKPAGIEVGQYAPDFQLEPVNLYPDFKEWLGDKAPGKFEDRVMLSDLAGKKPIMLFFGSYT